MTLKRIDLSRLFHHSPKLFGTSETKRPFILIDLELVFIEEKRHLLSLVVVLENIA